MFELEKRESDVNDMWKEKERKRDLEDKTKKDFRDEEAKLIGIGMISPKKTETWSMT